MKNRASIAASTPLRIFQALLALLFMWYIGVVDLADAFGLILPGLIRIGRRLTPLAALGLFLEMIGATIASLEGDTDNRTLLPIDVGLLCVAVAYGRRSRRLSRAVALPAAHPETPEGRIEESGEQRR
jgi:hypothetical protein